MSNLSKRQINPQKSIETELKRSLKRFLMKNKMLYSSLEGLFQTTVCMLDICKFDKRKTSGCQKSVISFLFLHEDFI